MRFRASFCDPFQKAIIQLGEIEKDKIVETFQNIDWNGFLEQMEGKSISEIFHSPSFEVENVENKNGISISAIDENGSFSYAIFFNRPAEIDARGAKNYKLTDIWDQKEEDVVACLNALINNDLTFLENKIQ